MFWTSDAFFHPFPFASEAELEAAVGVVAETFFGPNRIYLDVKKLIGKKGKTQNIPDGYLIDLSSRKEPRLFLVENEVSTHHSIKHVAVQLLEFSLSFRSSKQKLKLVLKESLKSKPGAYALCKTYADANGFDNVDCVLDQLVSDEAQFSAIVVIDEVDDELETVLRHNVSFPVEILRLERFKGPKGRIAYEFEPFMADVDMLPTDESVSAAELLVDRAELDTIVVPAQEDGFQAEFLKQNRWHHIRIHPSMIPKIRYIAAYRVAPNSAITHVASVKSISLWRDTGKYVLDFAEPAKVIRPLKVVKNGKVIPLRSPRYTTFESLMKAKNLDEAFTRTASTAEPMAG